ncbi:MAG: hypothetical protein ABSA81_10755 [Candidatus Bathyarchaeia archaeon]
MAADSQMLEELRKIREAVTPKPAPPPPKGLWAEFMDFLGKAGVLGLPVGNGMNFAVGDFVGVIIDFLIVASVIFVIAKYAGKMGPK